jgi:thioredoxin reductase
MYDIIIIGGGPAGLTAAVYARRANKSVLVIEKETLGGQITFSPNVENIPGFTSLSGSEFAEKLTDRELDVLRELTRNLTNEEIAEKLSVSASTIKRHIENILQKTGYKNRIDLAMNAKALGLVVSDEDRTRGSSAK